MIQTSITIKNIGVIKKNQVGINKGKTKFNIWHRNVKLRFEKGRQLPLVHHNNDIQIIPIWVVVEYISFGIWLIFLMVYKESIKYDY